MNISGFIKNITDQVIEAQLKLGYAKECIRLYYPVTSLNTVLGTNFLESDEMCDALKDAFDSDSTLKGISFCAHEDRIEVRISADGTEYIHKNIKASDFLRDIIELFSNHHGLKLDEIKAVFGKFSSDYKCEKMPEGSDFDYVLYFCDKTIDEYYYCVKMEMGHTIYHRFTQADYFMLTNS